MYPAGILIRDNCNELIMNDLKYNLYEKNKKSSDNSKILIPSKLTPSNNQKISAEEYLTRKTSANTLVNVTRCPMLNDNGCRCTYPATIYQNGSWVCIKHFRGNNKIIPKPHFKLSDHVHFGKLPLIKK